MSRQTVHPPDLPWLLLPNTFPNNDIKYFLSISTHNLHHLNLPAARGKTICGSSNGWLILIDDVSTITLINPLNSAHIRLPQISTHKVLIHKAILSSDPECDPYNFVVMVIYGEKRQLAYYKVRSESWEVLEAADCYYDDVISDGRRKLYAVNEYGKVVACTTDSLPAFTEVFMPWSFEGNKVYLLRIEGIFFVVFRSLKDHPIVGYETSKFSVFQLSETNESHLTIGSFPTVVLFLGQNESAWLPVDDTKGIVGNCIYFTDDYTGGGGGGSHDCGRYNMEDDSIERFQCCNFGTVKCFQSRPIYFT